MDYLFFGDIEDGDIGSDDITRFQQWLASMYCVCSLAALRVTRSPSYQTEFQRYELLKFRMKLLHSLQGYNEERDDISEQITVVTIRINSAKDHMSGIINELKQKFRLKYAGRRNPPKMTWPKLKELMDGTQLTYSQMYQGFLEEKEFLEQRRVDTEELITQTECHLSMNRKRLESIRKVMRIQKGTQAFDDMLDLPIALLSDEMMDIINKYKETNREMEKRYREEEHLLNYMDYEDQQQQQQGERRDPRNEFYNQHKQDHDALWEDFMEELEDEETNYNRSQDLPQAPQASVILPKTMADRAAAKVASEEQEDGEFA